MAEVERDPLEATRARKQSVYGWASRCGQDNR